MVAQRLSFQVAVKLMLKLLVLAHLIVMLQVEQMVTEAQVTIMLEVEVD